MKEKLKKLNIEKIKKILLLILYIVPFFRIDFITLNIPIINKLYGLLELIVGILMIYYIKKEKIKLEKKYFYLGPFFVVLLISTIINNGSIKDCIHNIYSTLVLCLVILYGMQNDVKNFILSFVIFLSSIVFINFITIVFFRNGLYINKDTGYYDNWFLGFKNAHLIYIIPLIMLCCAQSYLSSDRINKYTYFIMIISFVSAILVNNSTGMITLFIYYLLLIITANNKKNRFFNIISYSALYIIFFLLIIVFKIQKIFSFFIENIFHKDITFTGRTFIWEDVMSKIQKQIMLGYGNDKYQYSPSVATTHNGALDIIYKSGIVGSIAFLFFLVSIFKELYKARDNIFTKIISSTIGILFLTSITEAYNFTKIIYILFFGYLIEYFIKEKEGKDNDKCNSADI